MPRKSLDPKLRPAVRPASPAAPAIDRAAVLSAGLKALGLHLEAEQQAACLAYLDLMARWNRVYNLTALRDPASMLSHHLLDSLAALPAVKGRLGSKGALRVLDVGSGGGLPGVVWAIAEPGWSVTCLDAVEKKTAFVAQVSGELGLPNLKAAHARVEQWASPAAWDLITSRAFASLLDFVMLTRHLLAEEGVWVALKGRHPEEEIQALPADVEVFHVEPLQVPGLDAERCAVWMRPAGRR